MRRFSVTRGPLVECVSSSPELVGAHHFGKFEGREAIYEWIIGMSVVTWTP